TESKTTLIGHGWSSVIADAPSRKINPTLSPRISPGMNRRSNRAVTRKVPPRRSSTGRSGWLIGFSSRHDAFVFVKRLWNSFENDGPRGAAFIKNAIEQTKRGHIQGGPCGPIKPSRGNHRHCSKQKRNNQRERLPNGPDAKTHELLAVTMLFNHEL